MTFLRKHTLKAYRSKRLDELIPNLPKSFGKIWEIPGIFPKYPNNPKVENVLLRKSNAKGIVSLRKLDTIVLVL